MNMQGFNHEKRWKSDKLKDTKDVLVFDVDGTLVDTLPHIYRSYIKAAQKLKLNPISLEYFRDTYTQADKFRKHSSMIGVPEHLITEFNYSVYEYFKQEIKINRPKLIPGVKETLTFLKSNDVDLRILSLDSPENTCYKVGDDMIKLFTEILPHENEKLPALIRLKNQIAGSVFYIGDCVSDGEVAVAAGVNFIGLTSKYSFSSERKMREFILSNLTNSFEVSTPLRIIAVYQVWRGSDGIF
jgi:phosphoglycolate phosphatase-like HAD superfamily hydrolase